MLAAAVVVVAAATAAQSSSSSSLSSLLGLKTLNWFINTELIVKLLMKGGVRKVQYVVVMGTRFPAGTQDVLKE